MFNIKNIVSKHQLYYLHSDNSRRVAIVVQQYSLMTLVLSVCVVYCTHKLCLGVERVGRFYKPLFGATVDG